MEFECAIRLPDRCASQSYQVGKETTYFEPPVPLEGKVEIYMAEIIEAMQLALFEVRDWARFSTPQPTPLNTTHPHPPPKPRPNQPERQTVLDPLQPAGPSGVAHAPT